MDDSQSVNAVARDQALARLSDCVVNSTARVEYRSNGKVIVIGDEIAMEFAPRLRECDLKVEVLLIHGGVEPGETVIPAGGRKINITGYMGEFRVALGETGSASYEVLQSDLILDLGDVPQLTTAIKPPGYLLAEGTDEGQLNDVMESLRSLKGTFEKPRFFDYDLNSCAHGRAGRSGCTACLDACPADAITSLVESIEVNPYLCQGGGVCATVCPTGAIRYVYPSVGSTLDRVQEVMHAYTQAGGEQPVIAFIAETDFASVVTWPDNVIPIVLEELASVGLDVWLSTLAYGARAVFLIEVGSVPANVKEALHDQLDVMKHLLSGFGYEAGVISYQSISEREQVKLHAYMPAIRSMKTEASNRKREVMFNAIDHLVAESVHAMHDIPLPESSPFGQVTVDADKCTLCMGCTSVCPSHALQAGNDVPRLSFIEESCVQCGLCESACPEQAIHLAPRLITDPEQRRSKVTLNEENPFLCISCNKPFATQTMIESIMSRLSGHAMFQTERAKQRLMMCEDCRVVDVVQDTQAMQDPALNSSMRGNHQ